MTPQLPLTTAELRLWWSATAPQKLQEWFFAERTGIEHEIRKDTYLQTGHSHIGIKYRGQTGPLEVKTLVTPQIKLKNGYTGEIWVKTKVSIKTAEQQCVTVTKSRYLKHFVIAPDGKVEQCAADTRQNAAIATCSVELGEIRFGNMEKPWTTLAFEAPGELSDIVDNLRHTLIGSGFCQLPVADAYSSSYPEQLARLPNYSDSEL